MGYRKSKQLHIRETQAFRKLSAMKWDNSLRVPYVRANFQNCMHGGCRPKKTTLQNACVDLAPLEVMCDDKHTHKPWGMLRIGQASATAEERRYPPLLCKRSATQFKKLVSAVRKRSLPDSADHIAANKQPRRGHRDLFPLLPTLKRWRLLGRPTALQVCWTQQVCRLDQLKVKRCYPRRTS